MTKAKIFRLRGTFHQSHHEQTFSKEVLADSPEHAKDLVFSLLGSKHAVPRRLVKITDVKEVPADQAQDPVVRHLAGV